MALGRSRPVADRLQLGPIVIRWYALSYLAMIVLGWWYLRRLVARPGAPMSAAHVDDLVGWLTLGVIAGGRISYCLFYCPEIWLHPLDVLKLCEGGMALHGGFIGVMLALWLFTRRAGL